MQTLLLLHGAIGSSAQLQSLAEYLSTTYNVYTLDFSGHGGCPGSGESFSMKLFAADVLAFMDKNGLRQVSIFGFSMGGYVGMYLARTYPERINKLITLATKFYWDEAVAAREVKMLDPDKIEQKIPAFAETLKLRHTASGWRQLLAKTAEMMIALGNNNPLKVADYEAINIPVLVMLGDRDKMVTLDETLEVFRALPNGSLCVLPATQHPIEQVDINLLAFTMHHFIS